MPLISVVMPMRNAARYVGEAVASVLAQPGVDLELVVVDDGSTDDSARVVRGASDPRIKLIPGPKQGIAAALNAGLAVAQGDYFARCDADDTYEPDRLRHQLLLLQTRSDLIAVCGSYVHVTPTGKLIAEQRWSGVSESITHELRAGVGRTHLCTFLVRMSAMRELGGFRPYFIGTEDNDFQLRLGDFQLRLGDFQRDPDNTKNEVSTVWYEPRKCYRYRLHGESITHTQPSSQRKWLEAQARTFQLQRQSRGWDDLDRDQAAELPIEIDTRVLDTRSEMRDLLLGSAWKLHAQGQKGRAIRQGLSALRCDVLGVRTWRSVASLLLKPAGRG